MTAIDMDGIGGSDIDGDCIDGDDDDELLFADEVGRRGSSLTALRLGSPAGAPYPPA